MIKYKSKEKAVFVDYETNTKIYGSGLNYCQKEINDNYLKNFLTKNVEKNWDDLYSKIVAKTPDYLLYWVWKIVKLENTETKFRQHDFVISNGILKKYIYEFDDDKFSVKSENFLNIEKLLIFKNWELSNFNDYVFEFRKNNIRMEYDYDSKMVFASDYWDKQFNCEFKCKTDFTKLNNFQILNLMYAIEEFFKYRIKGEECIYKTRNNRLTVFNN